MEFVKIHFLKYIFQKLSADQHVVGDCRLPIFLVFLDTKRKIREFTRNCSSKVINEQYCHEWTRVQS